jgi:diphthamide synthase (EF-2-diphthine--ammonia ligase)
MQKDLNEATESLANGLNKMYDSDKTKSLMSLVKRQSEEIDRRGKIIMKMEDSIKLQQENIQRLAEQAKNMELMLEDMRSERQKLLEEIKDLKAKKKRVVRTKAKKQVKEGDTTQAA